MSNFFNEKYLTCWAQRAEAAGFCHWARMFLEQLTATMRARGDMMLTKFLGGLALEIETEVLDCECPKSFKCRTRQGIKTKWRF
jgi:hypothetical protein